MPALSVAIDQQPLATVSMDGYDVINVRVGGTRIDGQLASLDLFGGRYPAVGESCHLTWISEYPIQAGQVITVTFLETASTSHAGKTIEELFPDKPAATEADFKPEAEIFAALRAAPVLRDKYSFRLESSAGTKFYGETAHDDHGFGYSVLWNSYCPERVRVSLRSYTLNTLEARLPGRSHVEETLNTGGWVSLELIA